MKTVFCVPAWMCSSAQNKVQKDTLGCVQRGAACADLSSSQLHWIYWNGNGDGCLSLQDQFTTLCSAGWMTVRGALDQGEPEPQKNLQLELYSWKATRQCLDELQLKEDSLTHKKRRGKKCEELYNRDELRKKDSPGFTAIKRWNLTEENVEGVFRDKIIQMKPSNFVSQFKQ